MTGNQTLTQKFIALLACNQRISSAENMQGLAERVVEGSQDVAGPAGVGVHVVDEQGEKLELLAFGGIHEGFGPGANVEIGDEALVARVVREGTAVGLPDIQTLGGRSAGEGAAGSQLVVPMRVGLRAVGAIDARKLAPGQFTEEDTLLLQSLASYAGAAVNNLRVRAELSREKTQLQVVLDCSADAIVTTDNRGNVTFFSPGAEELFGHASTEVNGTKVSEYYLGGEREARHVQAYLEDEGKVRNYEAWFKTARGEPVPTSLSASVLRSQEGEVLGTLGILKDITVEKRLERKLSYTIEMLQEANENLGRLAVTDSLSGLKNQRYFRRKLEEEMLRATRTGRSLSLLLIDLDKFKRLNDTFGHQVGDRVIQEMGATINECIRQIDHGCRYGGEEFTIILPETSPDDAVVVGRRIQETFAKSGLWKELDVVAPSMSIGLAAFQQEGDTRVDTDALVKWADEAMYEVKARGGNDILRLQPH